MTNTYRDRAAVVMTAIVQIITPNSSSVPPEVREEGEALLLDEFYDIRRQAIADRKLGDDDDA
jgi:hypothetical protein